MPKGCQNAKRVTPGSLYESAPCCRGSTRPPAFSACGRTGPPRGRLRTWWEVFRREPAPGRLCSTSAAYRCAVSHLAVSGRAGGAHVRRDAPDLQRMVRVEQLGAVLARRDVDQRSAGVQRHPEARVVRRAPAQPGVAPQGARRAATASHHCDTSYTLPRSTSQQSPGVLCCATSLSENAAPPRTTVGGARCDARLPSGGIRGFARCEGGAKLSVGCTVYPCTYRTGTRGLGWALGA